ncbi:MAG: hypothetical protein ACUZ77_00450 [Candidatus Brocadiales bacterium]
MDNKREKVKRRKGGRMKRLFAFLPLCLLTFLPLFNAQGVTTVSWVQTTQSDFDEGIRDNISTHSTGEITLSPMLERVDGIAEPYVWCMTTNVYGTIYVGTGEPGTVYKIPSIGSSLFVKKEAIRLYRTSELHVHSIAVDSNGNVYAGTSPNGIIYKITPSGQAAIWCQLPVHYIWSMAFDSKDNLYTATGESGIIYKITTDRKVTVLFDSPESHILTLVIDEDDNIYGGSEPNGIIYKIGADGKASVLYDAKESEIHCLALDKNGNLFAGTASGGKLRFPRPSPKTPRYPGGQGYSSSDTERRIWVDKAFLDTEQFNQPRRPGLRYPEMSSRIKGTPVGFNTVYKVTREGNVKKIFEVQNAFIFSLTVDENNDLYIGTGNEARIYKVTHDESRSNLQRSDDITITLMDISESQVLTLLACRGDDIYAGTGNNGSVLRVSGHYTNEGTFMSPIHDTGFISKWGRITWISSLPGSTKLTLATRTGNSSKPDSTWSEWSNEYIISGKVIKSPQARFIQYRARLTTSNRELSPAIDEVSIAYLPHNQAPIVSRVEVEFEGKARRTSEMTEQRSRNSKTGKKRDQNTRFANQGSLSIKTILWDADDPNEDRLSYKLYYRAIDERNWKGLTDGLYDTDYYLWDTTRVPDGKYQIKIVASDEPDNPPGFAISTEKICPPFLIDNTRPRILELEATVFDTKECKVKGIARDDASVISKIQYSLDATDWVSIFPEDQIFDAAEETFQLHTPALSKGEHTIIINALDSEGNVGSSKVVINVE